MSDETKPRTEVVEETRETLALLELDRTPRAEKMRRENAYFDGAHEVHFTERAFRPRHDASLDEIRAFVDALEVRPRAAAASEPLPPEPSPPVVPARVPEHYREPLEAAIRGALISVETVHRVGTGTVVDVAWEAEDGGERRGLFLVRDGAATPYDEMATRVDALPEPALPRERAPPVPADEPPAPASATPTDPAPEPKKGLLGRFGKARKEEAAPTAASEPAPEPEAPRKKRFGFGRK